MFWEGGRSVESAILRNPSIEKVGVSAQQAVVETDGSGETGEVTKILGPNSRQLLVDYNREGLERFKGMSWWNFSQEKQSRLRKQEATVQSIVNILEELITRQ